MTGTIISSTLSRDDKIYRIIPLRWLLEMFAEGKNGLARPMLWDDTFENLLQGSINGDGKIESFGCADDLYAQSWTLTGYSDALWRIYSPDQKGVRIKTTVGTLLDSLNAPDNSRNSVSFFIGKVQYLSELKLRRFAAEI